jgi:5,10-methylenetetrahydromethanopterin reductase
VTFGISIGYAPVHLDRADVGRFSTLAGMADDYGFEVVATHDSAFLAGDAFVRAALIGLATTQAQVGIRPTNPLTREPQVMASFLASLDKMTDGRAFVDIASGDSAILNIGLRPATRARIAEYITCVRELLAEGRSTFDGRDQVVRWSPEPRARIPIWVTAEGPKMLHLGGGLADSVVAGTGLTPDVVADTKRRIADGARAAGRDPSEVDVWFATRTAIDEDRARAREESVALVSSILHHSMRAGIEHKLVPPEYQEKVRQFTREYVHEAHVVVDGVNPRRMEELGLTDFAMRRWSLAGDVDDWIERVTEIAEAGATKLWISIGRGSFDEQEARMRLLGERVLPHFR